MLNILWLDLLATLTLASYLRSRRYAENPRIWKMLSCHSFIPCLSNLSDLIVHWTISKTTQLTYSQRFFLFCMHSNVERTSREFLEYTWMLNISLSIQSRSNKTKDLTFWSSAFRRKMSPTYNNLELPPQSQLCMGRHLDITVSICRDSLHLESEYLMANFKMWTSNVFHTKNCSKF